MLGNGGLPDAKQLRHLRLREPHGFVFQPDLKFCYAVGLVEDDLVLAVVRHECEVSGMGASITTFSEGE